MFSKKKNNFFSGVLGLIKNINWPQFSGYFLFVYFFIVVLPVLVLVSQFYIVLLTANNSPMLVNANVDNGIHLPESKNKPPALKLLFFGDVMVDRHIRERIAQNGLDYILGGVKSGGLFNGYDLVSANLEGAVTNDGQHYPPVAGNDFAFLPETIKSLKDYNFNFFNIANNHLTDQGQRGVSETKNNLSQLGFDYVGCADGLIGDCSSRVIIRSNKKIGLVGLSMVYSEFDLSAAQTVIKKLATSTDIVIVSIHWGQEYQHEFNKVQQSIAHELINAGADVIIGHHPHVVEGIEIYNNKPIFYSLGNFIFDQYFSPDTQQGLGVGLTVDFDGSSENKFTWQADLLPLAASSSQISLMSGSAAKEFFDKLLIWSQLSPVQAAHIFNGVLRD